MPPGLKWTGIGLLAGGAFFIVTRFAIADELCTQAVDFYAHQDDDGCAPVKAAWLGIGVASAATGSVLLYIGNRRREPRPSAMPALSRPSLNVRVRF